MGATAAVGAVAGSSIFGAMAKAKAGKSQQAMFEKNAEFADWQAQDALDRGAINEQRQRQSNNQVIGSQRTGFAAQGVDVNKGSALDVQGDAAYLGEIDALTIRNNATKEAFGFRTQAADLRQRGAYAQQEGSMDAINTIVGGGSNLLLAKYGGGPYTFFGPGVGNMAPARSVSP